MQIQIHHDLDQPIRDAAHRLNTRPGPMVSQILESLLSDGDAIVPLSVLRTTTNVVRRQGLSRLVRDLEAFVDEAVDRVGGVAQSERRSAIEVGP